MRLAQIVAVLFALLAMPALAQPAAPFGTGKKSDGRFTGIALITDNARWYELFRRPEPPRIRGKSDFARGERGTLALIFSDAEPRNGRANIVCDVTAFDTAGSRVVVKSSPCYEGPYHGPNVLHPALLDIQFTIGPDDPVGRAGFRVTMRDAHSGRKVELAVFFSQGTAK